MSLRSGRKPGGPASIAEMPSDHTSERTRSASSCSPHSGMSLTPHDDGERAMRKADRVAPKHGAEINRMLNARLICR